MKPKAQFEPHLTLNEKALPCQGEWMPRFRGWCVLVVRSGICYFLRPGAAPLEVTAGSALIVSAESAGSLQASQLSPAVIQYFCVSPERLGGLLTLGEQMALRKTASRQNLSLHLLPPGNDAVERMARVAASRSEGKLGARLRLLEIFLAVMEGEIKDGAALQAAANEGRERLRRLLNQMAASELMELSLSDLAPRMQCSTRHLSRLFREEVGSSFREKQNEMRMARACELLATSSARVVDVALTSGFHSSSPFSLLFKKTFGVSPGQWRQQHGKHLVERPRFDRVLFV